jgi:hypothetical protein
MDMATLTLESYVNLALNKGQRSKDKSENIKEIGKRANKDILYIHSEISLAKSDYCRERM